MMIDGFGPPLTLLSAFLEAESQEVFVISGVHYMLSDLQASIIGCIRSALFTSSGKICLIYPQFKIKDVFLISEVREIMNEKREMNRNNIKYIKKENLDKHAVSIVFNMIKHVYGTSFRPRNKNCR